MIKAMDDPHNLNKQLLIHLKPNIISMNKVVQLWENKIGHNLDKTVMVVTITNEEFGLPNIIS